MGEIVVQCEVENTVDRANASRGMVEESRVRRASIEGIVDTGAVMLMMPQNLVERLGWKPARRSSSPMPTSARRSAWSPARSR